MLSLLQRLLAKFRRQDEPVKWQPVNIDTESIDKAMAELNKPVVVENKSRGHVVKAEKRATYSPNRRRSGGAVVKTMPKQLRRMKRAQEKAPAET